MNTRSYKSNTVRALTILEMLVSTALLSLIVIGLTMMFVQTQKAFRTGIKQADVTDAGRTITDMIARDLTQIADAGNQGITNLFWTWVPADTLIQRFQSGLTPVETTNQLDEIYFLTHTNTTWSAVGYVVVNQAPGVGSLYRYSYSTNTVPGVFTNTLFFSPNNPWTFFNVITSVNFATAVTNSPYFSLVADGVVHLKIRTYDQNGNEPFHEYAAEYLEPSLGIPVLLGYPLAPDSRYTNTIYQQPTNTLPTVIQLEVGVLEPETYAQAKSMSANFLAQSNFVANAAGQTHIFRQEILVPGGQK